MSAIDNKHLLEIINVVPSTIPAKGDRKEFVLYKAQCIFHGSDQGVLIGQLVLQDTMKDTAAGKYLAEFQLAVNYKMEVVPRITALHPWKGTVPTPAPATKAA